MSTKIPNQPDEEAMDWSPPPWPPAPTERMRQAEAMDWAPPPWPPPPTEQIPEKAVPAGVAEQAPPEPYVPGSGDKLPAELRLVLGGYAGIACGLFVGGLACAVAAVFDFFGDAGFLVFTELFLLAVGLCIWVLWRALKALQVRGRFSRLLRRPSDPRTATVRASTRGGRTLVLDITPGGYQPLSEVRLALWTKAEMLMPGETVTVYGRLGSESPLLISSAQRGRAFIGTVESRSTVQPGPVTLLDKKVSGATLVEWAAWAASTTFSSTGLRFGYDTAEVDASRSAVRDAFLGVSTPPVRSDDLRRKQFSTHRPGYDKKEVDAFLEYAARRLAAMESTDRPAGPLVSGARLVGWATWAASTTFSSTGLRFGYDKREVDAFRSAVRDAFLGVSTPPVISDEVGGKQFSTHRPGYDRTQVAAFLDAARIRLAAMESTDRPAGPLVSGAILTRWAEWADSTTFRRRSGYTATEVDAFLRAIRDTFREVSKPPVRADEVRGKQFSRTDNDGPGIGYDTKEVGAFLEAAAWRLAAMESTDRPAITW
jgi:DivIVA domain-containing protein